MHLSFPTIFLAMVCGHPPQAEFQSANFVVYAESAEAAKFVAEAAEKYRKELTKKWLYQDSRIWQTPCHVNVCIIMSRVSGFTDVTFADGKVASHRIDIQGPLDRVLNGPLPHELTHVLFAHHFGAQPPRWADEGGAILSEDQHQGERQGKIFREMLTADKLFPLRRLLNMRDYPADVPCLYAQGHSVTRFLVDTKGRGAFLSFVKDGLERGWDEAAREQYGYDSVEHLEKAWLTAVEVQARNGRRAAATTWVTSSQSAEFVGLPKQLQAP